MKEEEKKLYKIYFKAGFHFGNNVTVGRIFDATCQASSEQDAEIKFWRDIRFGQEKVENNPIVGGVRIIRIEEVAE